jgi:WD40 repeat protein
LQTTPVRLRGHNDEITSLAFHGDQDDYYLVSSSYDMSVRLWLMTFDQLITEGCNVSGGSLSEAEYNRIFQEDTWYELCPAP